jgi:hypothetical protein
MNTGFGNIETDEASSKWSKDCVCDCNLFVNNII